MGLTRRSIGEQRTFTETELPEHLLQHELIDVLQMGFQAKQAQWSLWNQDSSLSRTLSDLSHSCLSWADDIVRAMARLGTAPDGRATTVSSSSNMINLEPAWRKEPEVSALAACGCRTFATWAGERADDPALGDEAIKTVFELIAVGFGDYSSRIKECAQP